MDRFDQATPSQPPVRSGGLGLLVAGALAGVAVAVVPCASLLAQRRPAWIAIAAALAVFPLLPLLWHGLAETTAGPRASAGWAAGARFGLRSLAVAVLVLIVSLANLGPQRTLDNVKELAVGLRGKQTTRPVALPRPVVAFGLEPFIPADATLAVGLSGSAATEQLLAAHGVDTHAKLAALTTCQIDLVNARILVAARGQDARVIAVRAPGLADERNLYCLVGVLGPQRVQVAMDGSGTKTVQVKGLLSRPLAFRVVDPTTLIASDGAWQDAKQLFPDDSGTASGALTSPLLRVDRGAPLWLASVTETEQGTWDLALDSRQEAGAFKVRGSSTPPAGENDRAQISVQVPLGFASALPEAVLTLGIRGVVGLLAASGGTAPIVPSAPGPAPAPQPAPAPAPAPMPVPGAAAPPPKAP